MSENRITNTSKSNPGWTFGRNPNAIEEQEKIGQEELIRSSQLPRVLNTVEGSENDYKKIGIKVLRMSKDDPCFFDVELPTGWSKRATDHTMWSELIDDRNNVVAKIFYKAAYYDRNAFLVFETK